MSQIPLHALQTPSQFPVIALVDSAGVIIDPVGAGGVTSVDGQSGAVDLSGTYVPTNPVISGVVLDADGNWTSWTEAGVACSATYDPVTGNMATLTVAGVTRTFSYDANDNLIGAA